MRPEEPISYRDLALALLEFIPEMKNKLVSFPTLQRVAGLYKKIIETEWDKRFKANQIEVITIEECWNLIHYCRHSHLNQPVANYDHQEVEIRHLFAKDNPFVEPLFRQPIDADLRVFIVWNDAQADVELHVIEPDGQRCYSMNNFTSNGGLISRDCVGFGPEEYMIRTANPGKYTILVKLFSRINKYLPVIVRASITTRYGTIENEQTQSLSVVLREEKKNIPLLR